MAFYTPLEIDALNSFTRKGCASIVLTPAELGGVPPVQMEELMLMAARIAIGIHQELKKEKDNAKERS